MAKSLGRERNTEGIFLINKFMTNEVKTLFHQIEDRYCKMTWTHTIQLKEADWKLMKSKYLKIIKQILSAISSAGIISIVFTKIGSEAWVELGTAAFTVILMLVTWLSDNSKLEAEATKGRILAAECHNLRNKYESLLADIKSGCLNEKEIVARRESLEVQENDFLTKDLPVASKKAIKKAKKALKVDMQAKTTEEEKQAIIPDHLRHEEE